MEKTINVIKVQKSWLATIKIKGTEAQPIHEIGYFDFKKGNAFFSIAFNIHSL